ncbi:MAG: asparagine synthase (glutamine-hydrolyzing) [Candidatus Binataceae bacterium]
MCGIAGVMMRDDRRADAAVLDLLERGIAHRGPDGSGRYLSGPVGLLNTRLAIIDLRSGDQPIGDAQGAIVVANGEIYNDPELRSQLPEVQFRTGSDCESPLHLYRRRGIDFAEELRGMYAIAIYDPASSKLILARDPFGIKPLYYVEAPGYFAFASEPQALIAAGLANRARLHRRARAELFQLKFTTGPDTIFSEIHRVLPGETLVISGGRIVERRRRNALPKGGTIAIGHEDALKRLDEILLDSVAHHLRSDVPYGLFLSGGIDSSSLAELMTRCSSQPVVAMTVGFPGSMAADERAAAQRIASAVHAEHHVVEMTEADFWNVAPRLAEALDDPTTDAAALPTFVLGKAVGGSIKVVLTGEGGDEMFCGYSRYRRARRLGGLFTRHARTRGEFKGIGTVAGAFDGWRDGLIRTEREQTRAERTFTQTLQAVDCMEWLPNDLLTKVDRCLMAHGVEGRTPFLDPVVSDFAFRLPDNLKATSTMSKRLLRDWISTRLPAAEPYARKTGFNPPVGEWIATRKSVLEKLVSLQPGICEIFRKEDVQNVLSNSVKQHQAAWSLVFYALWHSHHVLGVSARGTIEEVLGDARRAG